MVRDERREVLAHLKEKHMALPSQQTPGPDHRSPARTGILSSLPGRTVIQGVIVDILLALALVVYESTSRGEDVNWNLLWGLILKTALMTLASSIMRRVKPPVSPPG